MALWDLTWLALFGGSAAVLGWTYVGYAQWLKRAASRVADEQIPSSSSSKPSISVVIAARNESARINPKIQQLLAVGGDLIREIIVVCDHCTDDTAEMLRSLQNPLVKALELVNGQGGKAAAVNAGVAAATGDLILFNDVRQSISPDVPDRLAAWFDDPANGAVSGSLEIQASVAGSGKGLDTYWNLEKRIRHQESVLDSSIGCTGAIYMIRRDLYEPIPHDTLLDDVVIPMIIATKGYRVRFDPVALAYDPQPLKGEQEVRRKRRTLAGNFQMMARYPQWLLPWRNRLWFKLLSHKYLRVLTPLFLALCMVSTLCLTHLAAFQLILALQLACATLAMVGLLIPSLRGRIFTFPSAFLLLQLSVVRGFGYWLSMKFRGQQGWK